MQELRVYKDYLSDEYTDLTISVDNTPTDVIPMLRIQAANSAENEYSLMIASKEGEIKWLPSKHEFSQINLMDGDKIFAEPIRKEIVIRWPDDSSDTMVIDMTKPANEVIEIICSYFEVFPYNIWSMYAYQPSGNVMLQPYSPIAETIPTIKEIIMKQTIFHPKATSKNVSPLHIYISQYRKMILNNEFILKSEDISSLKRYKWFNSRDKRCVCNESNEEKKDEFEHLISLKGFGTMKYNVRMLIMDRLGHVTDQLQRVLTISSVAISVYKVNKNKPEFVRSFSTIYGYNMHDPYIKITFDREGKDAWFLMSSKCKEILTMLESTIKFVPRFHIKAQSHFCYVTYAKASDFDEPNIHTQETVVTEADYLKLLYNIYNVSRECIKYEKQHVLNEHSARSSFLFRSLLHTSQDMLQEHPNIKNKMTQAMSGFTSIIHALNIPCTSEERVRLITEINKLTGKAIDKPEEVEKESEETPRNISLLTEEEKQNLNTSINESLAEVNKLIEEDKSANESIVIEEKPIVKHIQEDKRTVISLSGRSSPRASELPILSFSAEDLNSTPDEMISEFSLRSSESDNESNQTEQTNEINLEEEYEDLERFRERRREMIPASPPLHGSNGVLGIEGETIAYSGTLKIEKDECPTQLSDDSSKDQSSSDDCPVDNDGIPLPFGNVQRVDENRSNEMRPTVPMEQSLSSLPNYQQSPISSTNNFYYSQMTPTSPQMSPNYASMSQGFTPMSPQMLSGGLMQQVPMQYGVAPCSPVNSFCLSPTIYQGQGIPMPAMQSSPMLQERQTPASPVNVSVQIDNSKGRNRRRKRSHKYSESSSYDDYESDSSSYSNHKKSPKRRKSKSKSHRTQRSRFIDIEGLNSEGLLSEIEETIDAIIMDVEAGNNPRVEQNTLYDLYEAIQERKNEFKDEGALENLMFATEKVATMKRVSLIKANRLSEDIEKQIRILRKASKTAQNKEPEFINFAANLEPIKPITSPIKDIPFFISPSETKTVKAKGETPDQELAKSLDKLKKTMLLTTKAFSPI